MAMDNQLLILGLIIDKSCALHIRKSLMPDVIYPFYRSFKDFNPKNPMLYANKLPDNFFSSAPDGPRISVSAIVGKNGCGKSTLVDIMLRLLNNLSYLLYLSENRGATFSFIKGVRASLYFSIGSILYRLKQGGENKADNDELNLARFNDADKQWEVIEISKDSLGDSFFYSIFLNYSIHAFNTLDYRDDITNDEGTRRDWLNACFHKNDGYTAPFVLNPKRDKGVIDINNENHLAKARLISLILASGNTDSPYTYINDRYSISAIILKFDPESVDRKFNDIFQDYNLKDGTLYPHLQERIMNAVQEIWMEKYDLEPVTDNIGKTALKYLVYKTLSIADTYGDIYIFGRTLIPALLADKNEEELKDAFGYFIDEIDEDPSHITFRLKQTL